MLMWKAINLEYTNLYVLDVHLRGWWNESGLGTAWPVQFKIQLAWQIGEQKVEIKARPKYLLSCSKICFIFDNGRFLSTFSFEQVVKVWLSLSKTSNFWLCHYKTGKEIPFTKRYGFNVCPIKKYTYSSKYLRSLKLCYLS
jgi:hypothetical protein